MEKISKIETFSGVCALVGISLIIGSNYTNKTAHNSDAKIKNMRVTGGVVLGIAFIGMLLTKSKSKIA